MTIDTCEIHQYTELGEDGECPTCKALGSSPCSLKIVQILIAPENATWQGVLLGLGDDGNVYAAGGCGWEPCFEGKISRESTSVLASEGLPATSCSVCGKNHWLTDDDAGSDREMARLCTSCFQQNGKDHS